MIKKRVDLFLLGCLLVWAPSAGGEPINFPSYAGWSAQSFESSVEASPESQRKFQNLFTHYHGVEATPVLYSRSLDDAKLHARLFEFPGERDAFGFYSRLRNPLKKFVQVGAEGFLNGSELVFWKGRYCVQIDFSGDYEDKKGIMLSLGHKLAQQIPGDGNEPEMAGVFPEEELVPYSLVYEAENMLGIPGLRGGFLALYKNGGAQKRAQFVLEYPTQEEAKEGFKTANDFFNRRGIAVGDGPFHHEDFFACRTPERRYFILRHGIYLVGFFPAPGPEELEAQVREIEKRLNRRKLSALP